MAGLCCARAPSAVGSHGGLLIATTEKRTRAELDGYAAALEEVLNDA